MSVAARERYDAFKHLSLSLFWKPLDLLAMFTVYCDETGTDDKNRVAAVCGYIGQAVEWKRFGREWSRVLRRYKVEIMHRSHLETWHGEFTAEQGWEPLRRNSFLSELHPIIKAHTKVGIGSAVIKKDFDEVMPDSLKKRFGGVYGWCAYGCIAHARNWCRQQTGGQPHPMDWIFEDRDGTGQVKDMFDFLKTRPDFKKEFRIGPLTFGDKILCPLQAADTIAYEIFKQIENQILDRGKKHDIRFSAKDLIRATDLPYLKYWNKPRLQEWVENWRIYR